MSSHESSLGVVLVPAASAAREPLARAAAQAGLRVVETPEQATLGLVDLTSPEGSSALTTLLATPAGARLSLVALVDPGEASFDFLESLKPAEVMTVGGQPHELAWRLRRVAERHRERQELMRRQQDLSLLVELTADYAESFDVEALLHDVTRRLAERLGVSRAALVMLDRNGEGARVVAASDAPNLQDLRIDLDRYPEVREAGRTGKPVIVEDASHHPLLEGVQNEVAARGIQALAALPLHIRGEVRGVLLLRASGGTGAPSRRMRSTSSTRWRTPRRWPCATPRCC
ncbi:Adenylate cyclase [Archangium gephyra]|uniref:Adenylate cyclase n=1 Tax=Archangium gephyra TaxID=48 RepID=A0AAC8QI30_9BACT|nr:Adenylate cyclase [Archangium gephyra]